MPPQYLASCSNNVVGLIQILDFPHTVNEKCYIHSLQVLKTSPEYFANFTDSQLGKAYPISICNRNLIHWQCFRFFGRFYLCVSVFASALCQKRRLQSTKTRSSQNLCFVTHLFVTLVKNAHIKRFCHVFWRPLFFAQQTYFLKKDYTHLVLKFVLLSHLSNKKEQWLKVLETGQLHHKIFVDPNVRIFCSLLFRLQKNNYCDSLVDLLWILHVHT